MGSSQLVTISFAAHLQRHVPCPSQSVGAGTLALVLDAAFTAAPAMRSYVLDDQNCIRKHVAIFINGVLHNERNNVQIKVLGGSSVHVIQALSGG